MLRLTLAAALLLATLGSCTASESGPDQCVAAGGQCVLGNYQCPYRGTQDCNPDRSPGGAFCCLGCPTGTTPAPLDGGSGMGIACVGDGGGD
jgi:hypothetical protein